MSLKGDFKDINITDIIQLIGRDRKSGYLFIRNVDNSKSIRVSFFGGKILFVDPCYKSKKNFIGQRLLKARIINKEDLQKILKEQKKSPKPIYELMIEMNILSFDIAKKFLLNQMIETMYSLFLWTDGYWEFETTEDVPHGQFKIAIAIDALILDAARVIDEWKQAKKIISENDIFKKIKFDGDFINNMDSQQAQIYELINGTSTVSDLIERSIISKFEIYLILNIFIKQKVIYTSDVNKQASSTKDKFNLISVGWNRLIHHILLFSLLLLILFFAYGNISFIIGLWKRMIEYPLYFTTKTYSPSEMGDTFYMLESGRPYLDEEKENLTHME